MELRDSRDVILDLKDLVNSKGYIYALCLIIIDDFHFDIEKIHELDNWSRLNKNEVLLILGLIIQKPISLDKPDSPFILFEYKKRTYLLMEELHRSTGKPMVNKFKPLIKNQNKKLSKKDFFGGEDLLIEPIFYGGDGIYDFQYLDFLERKYKYDESWLNENKEFFFEEIIEITLKLKKTHQDKIGKINFFGIKEDRSRLIKEIKKSKLISPKDQKLTNDEFLILIELFQYYELFKKENHSKEEFNLGEISEIGWSLFYEGLIDLFCVSPSDFIGDLDFCSFFENFSLSGNSKGLNKQYCGIGDFNLLSAKPIIKLDKDRYFIPITFSVFEAVYESPYYWMLEDKDYLNKLAEHRGKVGEEITYELLSKVFGANRVFKSVRIESKKGHDDTDIDVLCVLGSKALCVQVKSKKLTQLSRKGDSKQLMKDFKGAVQDAYEQGIICRERLLEKTATFYNSKDEKIKLSENIEEVYILGVITENYPTLTHQTFTFLEKKETNPYPLFLTIFDLELVLFYLDNPYDFLYYVRQRIGLMESIFANEEIDYLGYHLMKKLWKDPKADFIHIDTSFAQLIDRNYYPLKLGVETSSDSDRIRNRWKNDNFDALCTQISNSKSAKATDVIFHLLDWSIQARENLLSQIKKTKAQTEADYSWHNFSMLAGPERSIFGLTFISWENDNPQELMHMLLNLSRGRKYKSKADHWIGIGCLKNSGRFVDGFVFNDKKWMFDESLAEEVRGMFEGENKGKLIRLGEKIGRNELCPCSSGKKYKYCCGGN